MVYQLAICLSETMQLVTRSTLLRQGYTDRSIARSVTNGDLLRHIPGIYIIEPSNDPDVLHKYLAQCLTPPKNGAWAMETAALIHGLPVLQIPSRLEAVVPGVGRSRQSSRIQIRSDELPESAIARIGETTVTSICRTIADISRFRSFQAGVVVTDAALCQARRNQNEPLLRRNIADQLLLLHGHKGISQARHVVNFANSGAESPGESLSRIVIDRLGFPPPLLQYEVRDETGRFLGRSDMAWPQFFTLGEYDGRGKYRELRSPGRSIEDVVDAERRRQNRLEDQGWTVVRWGAQELRNTDLLAQKLNRAFNRLKR